MNNNTPPQHFTQLCDHCGGIGQIKKVNPKWLKWKRKAAGKSIRAIAKELGFSAAYLSDIELGRRNASPAIVEHYNKLKDLDTEGSDKQAQARIQTRIYRGELDATDADGIDTMLDQG